MPESISLKFDLGSLAHAKNFVLEFLSSLITACNTDVAQMQRLTEMAH